MSSTDREDSLKKEMDRLGLFEEDLIEKFILGTGSGGQKINKTSSCVYLKHLPTGIEIKCQKERSREANRQWARGELVRRVKEREEKRKAAEKQLREKKRRQKQRRTKKIQREVLAGKKKRSEQKKLRRFTAED